MVGGGLNTFRGSLVSGPVSGHNHSLLSEVNCINVFRIKGGRRVRFRIIGP